MSKMTGKIPEGPPRQGVALCFILPGSLPSTPTLQNGMAMNYRPSSLALSPASIAVALILLLTAVVPWMPLAALVTPASAGDPPPVMHHEAEVRFYVPEHGVRITDRLTLPAAAADVPTELHLGAGFELESLFLEQVLEQGGEKRQLGPDLARRDPETGNMTLDLSGLGDLAGATLILTYVGNFLQSTEDVTFSRENVGGEITATISDEGIYLSSGAGWLATADGVMATHTISSETPADFETVTQGVRTARMPGGSGGEGLLTIWKAEHPSDGINLIAARFTVSEATAGEGGRVTVYTYLLEPDDHLRELYTERTQHYIAMYEEMIGPYPYTKFATVENWFPTGYGMPSYTLLGSQVLRLPFIPYTSFGHEICHSWWGNSVFVDVSGGNWCEGLTSYCADYHYKLLESEEAARTYRRNLLKDYAAYVSDPEQDFPLQEFVSRHSGATRAVGYGKSLYVFHMIERAIGTDAFRAAMRDVAREFTFRPASWSDFLAAFAARGDVDPAAWREQWIERAGAPTLILNRATRDGDRVEVILAQGVPTYRLDVPVIVTTADGPVEQVVTLSDPLQRFEFEVPGATAVAVDPDYHVFRRLDPGEIEPTISQVLAAKAPVFSLPAGESPDFAEAGRGFAKALSELELINVLSEGEMPVDLPPHMATSTILLRTGGTGLAEYLPAGLTVAGSQIILAGKRYSLQEYDLVFTVADPHYPHVTDLVVISRSPERMESLGRRLGHYGKYSWLLLPTGRGRVIRGNWEPPASPLRSELEG